MSCSRRLLFVVCVAFLTVASAFTQTTSPQPSMSSAQPSAASPEPSTTSSQPSNVTSNVTSNATSNATPNATPNTTTTSASTSPNSQNALTFSKRYPRYKLRPGDVMDLNFQYSPEFNQTVTVQPDGYIALCEIGDINVNGLTAPEVKAKAENAYSKILAKPEIGINLKDFDKPSFTVAGQVGKPGRYDLRGDTTVIEGVALAGGFTTASKHSQVVLVRRIDDQWSHAQLIDVKKLMASKELGEDIHLQPGDMLIVPQNRISKIRSFIPSSSFTMLPTKF